MSGFLPFLVVAAIVLTTLALIVGIVGFARGGEFNRKHGNKMMQYRIIFQAVAIVLICGLIFLSRD